LVQNAVLDDFALKDFWFKNETFSSGGTFGARPGVAGVAPKVAFEPKLQTVARA
jgi:hypothetical protein